VLRYLHALSFKHWIFVYSVVIQVVFVSVMTDLTDRVKPTYYSSCVWVCHWVQALLSWKHTQTAQSEPHITTRIPLGQETCSLTKTISQIIHENHKLSLKIPEVIEQSGQCWQKAYRRGQRDSKWGPVRRRSPTREEHSPAGGGERRRAAILFNNPVHVSKKTQHFTITKFVQLIPFREIIHVYTENCTKPIYIWNAVLLTVSRWCM
jgi:hypothetical protein